MIGGFSDISKILLPIAQTTIPAIINKVIDSSTKGDYTPPQVVYQQPPVLKTEPTQTEAKREGEHPQRMISVDGGVNVTVNMAVFVVTDPENIEKIKDMSFSKTFEGFGAKKL